MKSLKLTGHKVVVPLKQEVYDKDEVPEDDDDSLYAEIEHMDKCVKDIIRREIELCSNAIKSAVEADDQADVAHFEVRLTMAEACLDYLD